MVLAGLNAAQWHSYHYAISVLAQSFTPKGLVHLCHAELNVGQKKGDEIMADLGWDLAGLVRLVYLTADFSTRKVTGVNAWMNC